MAITTLSPVEINKFERMSHDWWNPTGKFKPLHDLTPVRLDYVINLAKKYFSLDFINNLSILDIGCGGGLVSEPLAKLGAKVTAIDASEVNINIAKDHAADSDLEIDYQAILAEDLVKAPKKFKLILVLEIIEHVENIEFFIETCCKLLEPDGLLIFSTINQTIKAYLESIIAAEYILRWLPVGTHEWSKFVKPSQINRIASMHGMNLLEIKGLSYKILSTSWELSDDIDNNYFIAFSFAN